MRDPRPDTWTCANFHPSSACAWYGYATSFRCAQHGGTSESARSAESLPCMMLLKRLRKHVLRQRSGCVAPSSGGLPVGRHWARSEPVQTILRAAYGLGGAA